MTMFCSTRLINCPINNYITTFDIPDSATEIKNSTFSGCVYFLSETHFHQRFR
ncbi:hypothetical protein [Ruminococcus sp. YE78]|nr:hypothetical protein [Ruminococcus sp. YE78]